jgi:hypothetical protein
VVSPLAIDGSGRNPVASPLAIDGSGRNPVVSPLAIDGSGRNPVVSPLAIDGSGRNPVASPLAIDGSGRIPASPLSIDPDFQTVLVGSVESINSLRSSVTILGQEVFFIESTRFQLGDRHELSVGDYVAVAGLDFADGVLGATVSRIDEVYAPGASPVTLSGTVSVVDRMTGSIEVNGVFVDITSLETDLGSLQVGDYVVVAGVQPNPNGIIIAR